MHVRASLYVDGNSKVGPFVDMSQTAAIVLTYLWKEGNIHGL